MGALGPFELGSRSAVTRGQWLRLEIRWLAPKGLFELFLVYDIFFGESVCLKSTNKCAEGRKHISTTSNIFGPNQLEARRARQAPETLEGRSGPGRIRPSLGFIAVLEQSTGGCLNWGNREVIKRGAAEGRKGWRGCSLGGWRKCSPLE